MKLRSRAVAVVEGNMNAAANVLPCHPAMPERCCMGTQHPGCCWNEAAHKRPAVALIHATASKPKHPRVNSACRLQVRRPGSARHPGEPILTSPAVVSCLQQMPIEAGQPCSDAEECCHSRSAVIMRCAFMGAHVKEMVIEASSGMTGFAAA